MQIALRSLKKGIGHSKKTGSSAKYNFFLKSNYKAGNFSESLLTELKNELAAGETTHARSGVVAAKYVETLQRSNEQIVKLIMMLQKDKEKEVDVSLSSDEKENIFELIKETH